MIEDRHVRLQTSLDAEKSQQERNKLKQFATPTGLAGLCAPAFAC